MLAPSISFESKNIYSTDDQKNSGRTTKFTTNAPHILAAVMSVGSGIIAGIAVAPIVTIVDKAIVAYASGVEKLVPCMTRMSLNLILHPTQFIRLPAFRSSLIVFTGTYCTANLVTLVCDINNQDPFYPKAGMTAIVNIALNAMKDGALAKAFAIGVPRPVPNHVLGLFALRDGITMYGSFALPAVYSEKIQELGISKPYADGIAQLAAPLSMQLINTPLNLIGLDLYNNRVKAVIERLRLLQKLYLCTGVARMIRTVPAFGVGGLLNSFVLQKSTLCVSTWNNYEYTVPTVVYGLDEGQRDFTLEAAMISRIKQFAMFKDSKRNQFLIKFISSPCN